MKILLFDSGIGLIPSLNYLLKRNLKNDYYIEMEEKFFPFGNKNEIELANYIKNKIIEWEKEKFDQIYIVCNTMSVIIKQYISSLSTKIHLIIDLNIELVEKYNASIFGTKITCEYFNKLGINSVDGSHLVENIENRNISLLIREIKKLKFKTKYVVIGCTHFTHIIFLLKRYHPSTFFIDGYPLQFLSLNNDNKLSITLNDKAKKIINNNLFSHNLFT